MGRQFIKGAAMLAIVLALPACGFHPMMGAASDQPAVTEQLARVEIAPLKDRSGQMLRNRLIDAFYRDQRAVAPEYRLEISLDTGQEPLAVAKDASMSRGQWSMIAIYRLIHITTGRLMFSSNSRAWPGYNNTLVQYASFVSEQSAFDRGIDFLGDEIKTRVSLFFAREPDQRPTTK